MEALWCSDCLLWLPLVVFTFICGKMDTKRKTGAAPHSAFRAGLYKMGWCHIANIASSVLESLVDIFKTVCNWSTTWILMPKFTKFKLYVKPPHDFTIWCDQAQTLHQRWNSSVVIGCNETCSLLALHCIRVVVDRNVSSVELQIPGNLMYFLCPLMLYSLIWLLLHE